MAYRGGKYMYNLVSPNKDRIAKISEQLDHI